MCKCNSYEDCAATPPEERGCISAGIREQLVKSKSQLKRLQIQTPFTPCYGCVPKCARCEPDHPDNKNNKERIDEVLKL